MDARDLVQFDPLLGWKNRPGHVTLKYSPDYEIDARTGSNGFRDRAFDYRKAPNRLRVLCVGDSFTWGMGVEEAQTYPKVLESSLPGSVEVINAGVIGWGTAQEWLWLENEGMRYEPDIVVLGFYVNDFEDNATAGETASPRPRAVVRGGRLEFTNLPLSKPRRSPFQTAADALRRRSYFVRAADLVCRWIARSTEPVDMTPLRRSGGASRASRSVPARTETAALLERIQALCAKNGARLIVMLIPGSWDVGTAHTHTPRSISERQAHDAIRDICQVHHTRSLDMRPVLRAQADAGTPAYHTVDIHWTAAAHRVAAGALVAEVSRGDGPNLPTSP